MRRRPTIEDALARHQGVDEGARLKGAFRAGVDIDNTHVHYVFIIACARTRDYAEAKDAADSAERTLTELARLLSSTSPLFSEMHQLRSIIHAARQSLARQQQPQDLEKGLALITTIEECLTSKPK